MIKQRNIDNRDPLKLQSFTFGLGTVSSTITALPFQIANFRAVVPALQIFYQAASASGSVRVQITDSTSGALVYDSGVVATTGTGGTVIQAMNTLNPSITFVPPSDSALGALPLINQADTLTVTVTPVTATYTSLHITPEYEGV